MSTWTLQADRKVPALSHSNPPMMLATLSSNSTAMTGTVAHSKSEKIDTQAVAPAWALAAAEDMVEVTAHAAASVEAEEASVAAEAMVAASDEAAMVVEAMEAEVMLLVVVAAPALVLPRNKPLQILSRTSRPLEASGARPSMSETSVP